MLLCLVVLVVRAKKKRSVGNIKKKTNFKSKKEKESSW